MARVMRDATVASTATKIFAVCGPSWVEDSYLHWSIAVRAWAVGATRSLHDDDRQAIVYAIQELDEALMAEHIAIEAEEDEKAEADVEEAALDSLNGTRWAKRSWDRASDLLFTEASVGRQPLEPGWYRAGSLDDIEARENAGQKELFA